MSSAGEQPVSPGMLGLLYFWKLIWPAIIGRVDVVSVKRLSDCGINISDVIASEQDPHDFAFVCPPNLKIVKFLSSSESYVLTQVTTMSRRLERPSEQPRPLRSSAS